MAPNIFNCLRSLIFLLFLGISILFFPDKYCPVNEALELEDRLRRGAFLTANQFLCKEKLKKDLRRVELAAAQGSLEFASEEADAIRENIADIDKKKKGKRERISLLLRPMNHVVVYIWLFVICVIR